MAVVSTGNEQLRDRSQALFGPDFTHPAALAEAPRCGLSAPGVARGRSLCEPAQSLLPPLAGLDRVPPAGPEWIEELNHRLDQDRSLAGALDDGLVTPWQAYRPDVEGPPRQRWRSSETEDVQPCLWRARHEYGWWRFAWTAG